VLGLVGLPLGGVAGVLVPMVIGALYRDDAFAAGALVSIPSAAIAVVLAITSSVAATAFVVLFSPVAVFLSGVLGRVGAAVRQLTQPIDTPADALPGSIADVNARNAIEQRRRGLVLVAVVVSFAVISFGASNRVNAAADRKARNVQRRLIDAAPGVPLFADEVSQLSSQVGAPVSLRLYPKPAIVADASYAWARRCVVVETEPEFRSYVDRTRRAC
jgi:hypothetical protein